MSLDTGSSKLTLALKNLLLSWDATKTRWTDPVAQAFEETHLLPLEMQVMATRKGIDRLGRALDDARRACQSDAW